MPKFRFPESSLAYFQFVFAAITPILFIGSVIGRIKFKVWLIFVPLWITFAYAVNAFLLWGGGFWAGKGALDLQRRLCDPPGRRGVRLRRRRGHRAEAQARPRPRGAEQPALRRRGCGHAVAGLERVQRR